MNNNYNDVKEILEEYKYSTQFRKYSPKYKKEIGSRFFWEY